MTATALSRRSFLKVSALAGGGFMIAFNSLGKAAAELFTDAAGPQLNAFIKIGTDGIISIMAPNPEIGQGVKTSLPMLVAEELDVDWSSIKVEQVGLALDKYTRQVAGGSGSIRSSWKSFREAGAAARQMFIEAASKKWNVNRDELITENGYVIHKSSNKKASYAELAGDAATLSPPTEIKLKDPKDFKIIGTRVRNVDTKNIVTGKPLFGIDTKREGMLYAMVARPPAFGKKLKSVDDTAARSMPGVKNVVTYDNSVAVLATSTWEAKKGRDALKIEWEDEQELESTDGHKAAMLKLIQEKHETPRRNDGDVEKAFTEAKKVLEITFEAPFLAHATLEPMNFFAHYTDDHLELYGPTQVPERTLNFVSEKMGIAKEKISVGLTRMGGGFGRRLQSDYALEAAMISKLSKVPVQVIWTREDDMQGGFYRPTALYRYRASIDNNNELSGWYLIAAAVNSANVSRENNFPAGAIPNYRVDSHKIDSAISTGPWRAPNHNFLAFAEESFIDEIAVELKKDPVAFRLELLDRAKSNPSGEISYDVERFKNVIKLAAEMGGWGKKSENGIYKGFGAHFSFGSYVAQVADVSIQGGKVKVHKVYCAVDCGRVVNFSGAENQVEGGIVDGLGHLLYGELSFEKGTVVQKNFNTYKLIRMPDTPQIEAKFVSSEIDPTGLGEPTLPPIGAAVCNAIYKATGQRVKRLPLSLMQFSS